MYLMWHKSVLAKILCKPLSMCENHSWLPVGFTHDMCNGNYHSVWIRLSAEFGMFHFTHWMVLMKFGINEKLFMFVCFLYAEKIRLHLHSD